ncbi:hypothetical protein DFH11DRAFT_1618467 [Phellopilus nigrolimitatus]|nr:hypothetical protein DFH11DRAFT_1618467 [Phellopilus nigrolimitatus]
MAKYTIMPPFVSAKTIAEQGIKVLGLCWGAPPIQGSGIEFSLDMTVIPARLLSPPKVIYSSGSLTVADGSWNTHNIHFHWPAQLTRAAILVLGLQGILGPGAAQCRGTVPDYMPNEWDANRRLAPAAAFRAAPASEPTRPIVYHSDRRDRERD